MNNILFALWFFLPVGVANVTPIFAAHISFLKPYAFPLDFHLSFRGKRVIGDHKTIRGLITGVFLGILTVVLQQYFYEQSMVIRSFVPIDYSSINPILLGSLAAFGALIGDGAKSFFKRQLDIKEGKSWFPFDQIDYILGAILFTYFYIPLTISQYGVIFVVWFLIHIISTTTGYLLRLKTSPI